MSLKCITLNQFYIIILHGLLSQCFRYVKDFDYYQKALMERYKMDNPAKKSRKRNNSGCLCFPGKSRRDDNEDKNKEIVPVVPLS